MLSQRKMVSVAKEIPVEDKTEKKKSTARDADVFADCSFSSLGLHPGLCDELKGLQFCMYGSFV